VVEAPSEAPVVTTEIPVAVKFIIAVAEMLDAGVKVKVGATVNGVP
jgi:hypothetical protein